MKNPVKDEASDTLSIAQSYIKRGFAIIPVTERTKEAFETAWQKNPVLDATTAALRFEPRHNIGLVHQHTGTFAFDVDHYDHATAALEKIGINLDEILAAPGWKIKSRNVKPIYRLPDFLRDQAKIKQFKFINPKDRTDTITVFELRASGQDLLPGSIHPNGFAYESVGELPNSVEDIPMLPPQLVELYRNFDELKLLMLEASPWYEPPKPIERATGTYDGEGVITQYNERVNVRTLLERNSYVPKGKNYLAPTSKTGVAGVKVFEDGPKQLVYSHHASDPLNGEYAHDAFSLLEQLECGGDLKTALDAARQELGLPAFKPTPKAKITIKRDETPKRAKLIWMDTIEAEEPSFLFYPYIPAPKLTFLEGDPGLGKTFIALDFCATITQGGAFPNGQKAEPGNVIYMTAEDGLADTLKPRLEKAGADCSRVAVLEGGIVQSGGKEIIRAFSLSDVAVLRNALEQTQAKLIVIDPIQGFLGGSVDMHRANEIRPILSAVTKLAEEFGCSIIGIRHLNKDKKHGALHRGLGSVDFTAFARSALLVGVHEDQKTIAHVKSNLAPKGDSLIFDIQDGKITWLGKSEATAEDVAGTFKTGRAEDGGNTDKLEFAKSIITMALDEAPTPSKHIKAEAAQLGISERTLARAKAELGNVKATPLRLPKAPRNNLWHLHWSSQSVSISEDGQINVTEVF